MTEDEWKQTQPGEAIDTFVSFLFSVTMLVVGNEVGSLVTRFLGHLAKRQPNEGADRLDDVHQAALRKGLLSIAAWSALESGIEDIAKAMMRADPHILEDERILKAKVPFERLLAAETDRLDIAYRAVCDAAERKGGVSRFEEILAIVGLGGSVPTEVARSLHKTQMVRNVWAHKAGIADAQFIGGAAHLGFKRGELVDIELSLLSEMIASAMTYGMIIGSRHRTQHGLGPMPMKGKAAETPIGQAYIAMYPDAKVSDTSADG